MSNFAGHIRLPRTLLRPVYEWLTKDPLAWSIYTYMLLNAAWGVGKQSGEIFLNPGEVWCSRRFLAKRFTVPKHKVSESRVQRVLTELTNRGLIRISNRLDGVYLVVGHEDMSGPISESNRQSNNVSNIKKEDIKEEVSKDTRRKRKPRPKSVAYTPDYEELWGLWPRPLDDKQRGAVAYFKYLARNSQSHDHVMACAKAYLATVSDPQYCKALANWLNSDSIERKTNAAIPRLHVNSQEDSEPGKLGLSEEQKANRLRRLAEIAKDTPAGPRRPGG